MDDKTFNGAVVWQTDTGWAFFFRDRHIRDQVIHMCRAQLGRGHHMQSAWHVAHARVPQFPEQPPVSVIVVRDCDMATQLKLMYT